MKLSRRDWSLVSVRRSIRMLSDPPAQEAVAVELKLALDRLRASHRVRRARLVHERLAGAVLRLGALRDDPEARAVRVRRGARRHDDRDRARRATGLAGTPGCAAGLPTATGDGLPRAAGDGLAFGLALGAGSASIAVGVATWGEPTGVGGLDDLA